MPFEDYGDRQHWTYVMEHRFEPAIRAAGFEPVRPIATGAFMIHAEIVKKLETCDLVLCDMSAHNANVFFELGVRTSLDKPVCLVKDDKTRTIPFDTSGINTHTYSSDLRPWNERDELAKLEKHIRESAESCDGRNPMWKQFGLTIRAQEPTVSESPADARLDLLLDQVSTLVNGRQSSREPRVVEGVVLPVMGGAPGGRSNSWRLGDFPSSEAGDEFRSRLHELMARGDVTYKLLATMDGVFHLQTKPTLRLPMRREVEQLAEDYRIPLNLE
jgi:hypothetical protein